MDIQTVSALIGSLGFPIFCCVMLFKQNNELRTSIDGLKDIITKLYERMDRED